MTTKVRFIGLTSSFIFNLVCVKKPAIFFIYSIRPLFNSKQGPQLLDGLRVRFSVIVETVGCSIHILN